MNSPALERLALLTGESEIYERLVDAELEAAVAFSHQTLGDARATYFRGVPASRHTLLLAAGSSGPGAIEWGDAGQVMFCIPDAALAARDWDLAYAMLDE